LGKETLGMESSTVLAFRIFVMLSCLIIVPMAAIFGSAFPDVVKSVLVDRIVAWSTGKPADSSKSSPTADGFSEVTVSGNATPAPPGGGPWEAPRWGAAANESAAWQQAPAAGHNGVVAAGSPTALQGGGNQSASFAAPNDSFRAPAAAGAHERAATEDPQRLPPVVPAPPAVTDPSGQPTGQTVAGPADQPDRFTAMERKLREYGAIYYLLETWGNEGELYRFHCRMAIANNPSYTRHFEATDRDALKAMAQVLARVESWRAGRLP
jgi:hypothetical protein